MRQIIIVKKKRHYAECNHSALLKSPSCISLPRSGGQVGLCNVLFEDCSAFTRVTACTLALPPYFVARFTGGFNYFVTSIVAPVAFGWSDSRVGFSPTGKAPPYHGARQKQTFPISIKSEAFCHLYNYARCLLIVGNSAG